MKGYEAWSSINIYAEPRKWTAPIFLLYWGHISLLTSWIGKLKALACPFLSFLFHLFMCFHSLVSCRCWELAFRFLLVSVDFILHLSFQWVSESSRSYPEKWFVCNSEPLGRCLLHSVVDHCQLKNRHRCQSRISFASTRLLWFGSCILFLLM